MKRVKTLRAKTGTYKDKETGQDKNAYQTIGYALDGDKGKMLKIDSIPVNFDGWVYFGDLESKPAQQAAAPSQRQASSPQQHAQPGADFPEDDIPF